MKIPVTFGTSCPGAKITKPTVKEITGSPLAVTLTNLETKNDCAVEADILANGPFFPESGPVHFEFIAGFEKAHCLTRKEAEEAYKNDQFKSEYIAGSVYTPTNVLKIEVKLPPSHRDLSPRPSAVAFVGETEKVNIEETQKRRACLEFNGSVATLIIDKPLLTTRYAITWMPPSA